MRLASLSLVLLLAACAHYPETRIVTGVLTKVDHDLRREAPCGIVLQVRDKSQCDIPPICCAYHLTLVDSTGHQEMFWAFWPRFAEGLKEGESGRFRIHRYPIYKFPCSIFGCQSDLDYMLFSDDDVNPR